MRVTRSTAKCKHCRFSKRQHSKRGGKLWCWDDAAIFESGEEDANNGGEPVSEPYNPSFYELAERLPDERAALESRVCELYAENAALKARLKTAKQDGRVEAIEEATARCNRLMDMGDDFDGREEYNDGVSACLRVVRALLAQPTPKESE